MKRILASSLVVAPLVLMMAVTAPASAQLFGPSDEQKAHEVAQDAALHELQIQTQTMPRQDARIQALEDKVRGLTDSLSRATGVNEELEHRLQMQSDKTDQMQKDFAYRLCQLSAQQLGAGEQLNCAAAASGNGAAVAPYSPSGLRAGDPLPPIDATGQNNNPGSFTNAPNGAPNSSLAPGRGRPPGSLGTLPMNSGPSQAGGSSQYDAAMNLMAKAQYGEASAAFRSYADANPDDTDLSPQAIYWIANISYIHQDYAPAARTFAEVIKKYPKSGRAPDAMLRLAQSFMAMGQKSESCTTLGLIKSKYPGASENTLTQAANLRKTACSK